MFTARSVLRWRSVCLAFLLLASGLGSIAVPQPKLVSAAGTTYYFSTNGNDANNGTSASTPKQSISAANALMSAGNTVLFKRGDAWYSNSVNGTGANIGGPLILYGRKGTSANPITIGAYGSGAKPMIATTHLLDDAGWIYDGSSNRWKHAVPINTYALRLFVNGVSKYLVTTTNSGANETHVDQTYEWYINPTTGWVYANSGSSSVGPKNVEMILASNTAPVSMGNTEYVTIQNLDIKGGVVSVDSPSAHIAIDNNTIRQSNQTGIRVYNSGTNNLANFSAHVSNITITNNVIDKVWTTYENDPAIQLYGDGIYMHDAVEDGLIRGNKIVNFGHSGIELASTVSTSYHGVHHVIVEQNDVSAGDSGYMHAFGVYGLPGETTDNIVRRNYFHDFTSVSHAGGSDNHFYSNIFAGVKLTPQPLHSQQPYALDIAPWGSMEARDLYIVNNTFLNTDHFSIQVTDYNAAPSNVTNNVIANNIFGQYGYNDNPNGAIGEVALDVSDAVTGTLYLNNNAFWDSSSNVARFKDPSRSVLYDINGLNACPNTTPDTCDANVKVNDPGFVDYANRDFRLSASSLIKASGTNAYAAALGSGFVDFYGKPWHSTTPSIGAIQQGAAAPSNLSAGRTPSYSSSYVIYETSPSTVTDGATTYYVGVGDAYEKVYAQIDLGALYDVSKVKMWHFLGRTYKDVIVQLSQTADFSSYVTTVFNNDKDNSAGQGYGVDAEYTEGASGKTVNFQPILARYARFWIGGSHTDPYNQFVELQVYGTTP